MFTFCPFSFDLIYHDLQKSRNLWSVLCSRHFLVWLLIYYTYPTISESCDSSVSIALGYRLDNWGSRVHFLVGAGNFSLHHHIQNASGAHAASYPMGTRGSFPEGKAARHEADHSPPSRAKVKECVELYLHYPIHLHGVVLS
jgi:hypothetical protein